MMSDHATHMNGTSTKASKKSFTVQEIDDDVTVDDDGREVLTLHIVDQAGKKEVFQVPFTQATKSRVEEMSRALLGRTFLQQRPEFKLKLDTPMASFEKFYPYDCLLALMRGFNQRSCRMDRVEQYANEQLLGNWEVTCQGWGFDINGVMVNGQHSAWACIKSGHPIETLVVRGLSLTAKGKIDRGYYRTNGCLLELSEHDGIDLKTLPPAGLMNAVLLRIFRLGTSRYHENVWNGNIDNLAHMVRKYKRALLWLKNNNYYVMKGVTRDFTKAPVLAAFVISFMLYPEETAKVADGVYTGSLKDRQSKNIRPIYDYLEAGRTNKASKIRTDSATHQALRILRGLRAVIEREKYVKDPVINGFPRTQDGRLELLSFFSPGHAPIKLIASDINLTAFDKMRDEEQTRLARLIKKGIST